jgi:hypothetical protein
MQTIDERGIFRTVRFGLVWSFSLDFTPNYCNNTHGFKWIHGYLNKLSSNSVIHYRKRALCRVPEALGKALKTLGKGFAECDTRQRRLDKHCIGKEWGPVPSVQHSVKRLVAESLTLPNAALGKAFFAECPTKGTRQSLGFR